MTATPEEAEYHEWMTLDFLDRQLDSTVVALQWENLRLPIEVSVSKMVDLYVETIGNELRNSPGFSGYSALGELDKALKHARMALPPYAQRFRNNVEGLIATLEEGKDIN